jgi:hypothetical protein
MLPGIFLRRNRVGSIGVVGVFGDCSTEVQTFYLQYLKFANL